VGCGLLWVEALFFFTLVMEESIAFRMTMNIKPRSMDEGIESILQALDATATPADECDNSNSSTNLLQRVWFYYFYYY